MTRTEMAKIIEDALLKDVNLSKEEYKQKCLASDKQTEINGIEGKASVSETVRARRIAMNFYGTVLNILVNLHATNLEMLAEQKKTNAYFEMMVAGENNTNGDK